MPVRVFAVALLKCGEVFFGERAVLLCDARYVGSIVINPNVLGRVALSEEDDVRLCSGAIGRERAVGEPQYCVQVAFFGDDFEDLARLVGEQAVVRHDDRRPTSWLERGEHVLKEVELLVARGDGEVVPRGSLIRPASAEGRIGEYAVEAVARRWVVDGVAQPNMWLKVVQVEIHQGQATRSSDQVLAEIGIRLHSLGGRSVEVCSAFADAEQPLIRRNKEFARAAGRVANLVVFARAWVGLHAADDGLNEQTRRKILPRPFLALTGRLFEQALKGVGFDVDFERCPLRLVDSGQQLLETGRLVETRLSTGEDIAEQPFLLAECPQHVGIVIG